MRCSSFALTHSVDDDDAVAQEASRAKPAQHREDEQRVLARSSPNSAETMPRRVSLAEDVVDHDRQRPRLGQRGGRAPRG